jgi:predicted anti-sigma-YlaC factor YlaD
MNCDTAREALSARMDGELEPVPSAAVDEHLAECASCRNWYAAAADLRRTMLVRPAPVVPDLTAAIMAQRPAPRRPRGHLIIRMALATVALVQTGLAMAELFGVSVGMAQQNSVFMMGHMSHESAAWNVAIGIGLAWAALRTRTAAAQLPMLTVFVGVLAAASVIDVVHGAVTADRLLSHIPVVAGVVLLWLVRRTLPGEGRPIPSTGSTRQEFNDAEAAQAQPVPLVGWPGADRRPTGSHGAA